MNMFPDNGFLIIASVFPEYADAAQHCAGSIKDYYPDAHITLVVSKKLYRESLKHDFDHIICDDSVPDHTRTKLWALSRTPYKGLTAYVDADMECMHEDVSAIWDQIEDNDILITKIRPYNGKIAKWATGEMIYHGGFFVYRNTPLMMEFMERWWTDYYKQRSEPWPYPETEIPITLRPWDQFTFWKLLNKDKMPVRVGVFHDDARWNFVNGYKLTETKNPIIFYHHTVPKMAENEKKIIEESSSKERGIIL
jgi:hypothetical protein